ncbi:MAG: T9SS type A sorting domain-containing protein [Lewinellaceae bacterium]|nr:T9SS type A sorting domain-containing protein [Lewinellaceae bacterium]
MKKWILPVAISLTAVAAYVMIPPKQQPEVRIPAGANEENRADREAYDLVRLADPTTGKIPEGITWAELQFAKGLPQAAADRSGAGWDFRGPWNVGGRTRALTLDVTNENRMMAGGVSGGLWLSEDAGQSWTRRTPLNAHPGCVSIAQDTRPGHTNTWYYLSGEIYGTSASATGAFYLGDGLFKSIDNGLNWNPVSSTAGGNPNSFSQLYQAGWRVITSPTDTANDVVYMATYGAIYRSATGGNTWTAVLGGNNTTYSYFTDIAQTSTGVLYAALSDDGPDKGIWRSTNGTQWTKITPDSFPGAYNRFVIGINPDNENEVYFLGNTPGFGHYNNYIDSDDWSSLLKYTYGSGDGSGANGTWEDLSANMPNDGTEFDKFACQGGYDLVVKVQPGTGSVFIGGTNIYRSTDGFSSPDNTTHIGGYKPGTTLPFFELYPNHHPDIHDLLFLPSNSNILLTASDGGLHRTEDCNAANVSWNTLNHGYQTSQFYTAMIEHTIANDPTLIGGLQDNGNFFTGSSDATATWKQTVNGDGAYGAILNGKTGYVLSIQQGRVAKVALDNDGNVTAFRRIDPIGPKKDDYFFINPLAVDPNDQDVLYLPAGRRLYRQSELGAIALTGEWDSIAQGWTQFPDTLLGIAGNISAIAVSQSNPSHRVYIGSSANKLFRIDNANTGTPNFTTQLSQPPGSNSSANVTCIAIDPDNADRIIVVYSNYGVYSMFLSENAGLNWTKVAGNLEANLSGSGNAPSLRWVSILPYPDGSRKYFCGTSVGLFSADTLITHATLSPGTQWQLEGPDVIGSAVVNYIETRAVDGLVVAATHGNGMFAANFMPVSGTNTVSTDNHTSIAPNPASDQITIYRQGAGAGEFRLYDLNGNLVRAAKITTAQHRLGISDVVPGVYVWSLDSKGHRETGKLVKQ